MQESSGTKRARYSKPDPPFLGIAGKMCDDGYGKACISQRGTIPDPSLGFAAAATTKKGAVLKQSYLMT